MKQGWGMWAKRGLVALIIYSHLLQVAVAQSVVPDAAAPAANRPTIGSAATGRPIVNIVTPQSGVSHNRYSNFQLDSKGVIINNSAGATTSLRGEAVSGNSNLSGGTANVILNEVRGPKTQLKGPTEIVGTTADVIISNTNGIQCDGCSFEKVEKATLSTGVPTVSGSAVSLSTLDGELEIARGGFTAGWEGTLSGRHVLIDGPVAAGYWLNIYGGSHTVNPKLRNPAAAPITASRTKPYAIDATAFGALNANIIRLVGNEAGLGVRLVGPVTGNDVELQSNGDLYVKNVTGNNVSLRSSEKLHQYGDVTGNTGVQVRARDYFLPGGRKLQSGSDVLVWTTQSLTNGGEVQGHNVSFNGGTTTTNTGTITATNIMHAVSYQDFINTREKFTVYQGQEWADAWLRSYQDLFAQWTAGSNPADVYWGNEYFQWTQTAIRDEYLLNGGSILGHNVTFVASRDFKNIAGRIAGTNDVSVTVWRDFENTAKSVLNLVNTANGCAAGFTCEQRLTYHPSEILAGHNLNVAAVGDINNIASTIAALRDLSLYSWEGHVRNYALGRNSVSSKFENLVDYQETTGGEYGGSVVSNSTVHNLITANSNTDYAPATIRSVLDNVNILSYKNLINLGGTIQSSKELKISSAHDIRLSTVAGLQERSITNQTISSGYISGGEDGGGGGYVSTTENNTHTTLETVASPAELIGRWIKVTGHTILGEGARIFAQEAFNITSTGRVLFDSLSDTIGKDAGQLNLVMPDVKDKQYDVANNPASTLRPQYDAYLRSDAITNGLLGLGQRWGGLELRHIERNIGTNIDFAISPSAFNWRQHKLLNVDSDTYVNSAPKSLVEAFAADWVANPNPSLNVQSLIPSEVVYSTLWDFAATKASSTLNSTTRSLLHSGGDVNITSQYADIMFLGGTFVHSGGNLTFKTPQDIVITSLRDTGLGSGEAVRARIDDFKAGLWWRSQPVEVAGIGGEVLLTGGEAVTIRRIDPTTVFAEGNATLVAGRDVLNAGGAVAANGNLIVSAANDVRATALRQNYVLTDADGCRNQACGWEGHRFKAAEFLAGSGLIVNAGHDLLAEGGSFAGGGSVLLNAANDLSLNALTSKFVIDYYKRKNWFSNKLVVTNQGVSETSEVVSEFGDVLLRTGRDYTQSGSFVSSGGNVSVEAGRDILLEAKAEEMFNVYKNRGFSGLGYSARKVESNDFITAFAETEATGDLTMHAGRGFSAVGAKFMAGGDITLSAVESLVTDAHQNHRFVKESGWSLGFTAPILSMAQAIAKGDGEQAVRQYAATNPLLGAVHSLATNQAKGLGAVLSVATGGIKLLAAANQNAQGPQQTLAGALLDTFNPVKNLNIDPFTLLGMKGDSPTAFLNQCSQNAKDCLFLTGITLRFQMWQSRKDWTETTVSRLLAGADVTLSAGDDLHLMGGTVVNAGGDAVLLAGNDIALSAVADTYRSRYRSWGASVGLQQNGIRVGVDGSRSAADTTVYSNAVVTAGGDATLIAGRDIALHGANVVAKNITVDAGRDLLLISQQNISKHNSQSFGVGITFGLGGVPKGADFSVSFAQGSRIYTDTPTTLIADEAMTLYAGRLTLLAGAGAWSKTGNLKLDTGDLAYDNYEDKNFQVSGGFGITIGSGSYPSGNVSASYSNVQGLTFATLGAGTTTVRDRPLLDITPLNRAPADMQRVTSSTSWSIAIPELNVFGLLDDLKQAFRFVNALTAELPDHVKLSGERGVKYYEDMLLKGASRSVMQEFVASGDFDKAMRLRGSIESARLAGHNPSVAELASVMLLENAVYKRSETTGEITIAFTCPTMGVCSYTLSQFQQIFGNDVQKQQAIFNQLKKGIDIIQYNNEIINQSMSDYFATMLRCSWEEPEIFRQFMQQYPTAMAQFTQALKLNPDAVNAITAEALRTGSTKDSIKAVYTNNLSGSQIVRANLASSLVSFEMMYRGSFEYGGALVNYTNNPAARKKIEDARNAILSIAIYVAQHPGEVTTEIYNGIVDFTQAVRNGDPDTIATLAVGALGGLIARAATISKIPTPSFYAYIDELKAQGVKFSPEKIIAIEKLADGRIIFLERGNAASGFEHILARHGADFSAKGIENSDIPSVIISSIKGGNIVGTNGTANVYRTTYNGIEKNIAIGVSNNGYIVRANPVSEWRPIQ